MGAYARQQNILTDDAHHVPLFSNRKSETSTISSLACVLNRPGTGPECPRRKK
jgi:hypothetical protein